MARTILVIALCLLVTGGLSNYLTDTTSAHEQAINGEALYKQLRSLKLSGEYCSVENVELKRDGATITFVNGEIHFLEKINGKVTGAVFIGTGQFAINPYLPLEQKHLSILTGKPSMEDKFTKMVLRFTDTSYNEIKKAATIKSGPPNSAAQSALDDNRKFLRKTLRDNVDLRVLTDLTWSGQPGFFYSYFDGKQYGNMLFGLDPLGLSIIAPEEVILICLDQDKSGIWVGQHITSHYRSGEAVFNESHSIVDLEHHKIDATVKGKRLDAIVETTVTAMVDGARVIPFGLFSKLRMKKVTDSKGEAVAFIQENAEEDADFALLLTEGLKKGEKYTFKFEYGGDDAVEDSGGGNFTLAVRSTWYPNSTFGDRATYEITLKAPKNLTMVATGQPMGETDEGDWKITRWKSDIPLAVAGFNYGKFKKSVVKDDKISYTIETYANKEVPDIIKQIQTQSSLGVGDDEDAVGGSTLAQNNLESINPVNLMDKARAEAQLSVAMYTNVFGPLPYGRIAMTQQPAPNFGQAWPMLVYMPLTAFLDGTQRHQLGFGNTDFFKFVGPHEVAHQWWGHIIGWKSYRDQWMSEGFSEFSASLFAQSVYKNQKFIEFWKELREQITTKNREGKRPYEVGSVYMGYRLDTAKTGNIYRSMVYPKGAFILHMIRMMMFDPKTGDQRFSEMMKDFVKTYYNQNVTTQDFWHTVEKHMTKEMDLDGNGKMNWFFGQWVYGNQVPDYKLEYRLESGEKGQTRLVGKVIQSNVDNAFKMIVPIYLDYDGKLSRLGTVSIRGNSASPEFDVMLPKKPKRVLVCAFEDVLCTTDAR